MARLLVSVVLGAAAVLALPGVAAGQSPSGDFVKGGQDGLNGFYFSIDASSGPAGEDPTGTIWLHSGGGNGADWNLDITCLSVSGNTAIIGYTGELFFFGETSPAVGLIRVADAGGPGSGLDTFDWAEGGGGPGDPPLPGPSVCSSFPGPFPFWSPQPVDTDITTDIVVHDGPAVPATKDQCKNGGWRSYGIFRNQGDCVSYIATGGRNRQGAP